MSIQPTGQWGEAQKLFQQLAKLPRIMDKALAMEAKFWQKETVRGVRKRAPGGQRFAKLAKSTRRARALLGVRGRRPLIRSGALLRSIQTIKKGKAYFVGVPRSARGGDGRSLFLIAQAHEEGIERITIKMTPKMQRFLFAFFGRSLRRSKSSRSGVVQITIPARPIFGPTMEKFGAAAVAGPRLIGFMTKAGMPKILIPS